nr:MAG TPA: hypothetical protein [Caudoviricetes sp.]
MKQCYEVENKHKLFFLNYLSSHQKHRLNLHELEKMQNNCWQCEFPQMI